MTGGIRGHLATRGVGAAAEFRWRGGEISRLEGFTDAVFAFAVTLLVVSLEVPKTFDELAVAMRGFVAFAVCFLLLFMIWYEQYLFFRRYGLQSNTIVFLNAALIFVVLFYVYPLKFLFTFLANQALGFPTDVRLSSGAVEPALRWDQMPALMTVFSAGYVAVFVIFTLLYLQAWRQRDELDLNEIERFDTRASIVAASVNAGIGFLSLLIAAVASPRHAGWAGIIYLVNAPVHTIRGMVFGRRRRHLEGRLQAAPETPVA